MTKRSGGSSKPPTQPTPKRARTKKATPSTHQPPTQNPPQEGQEQPVERPKMPKTLVSREGFGWFSTEHFRDYVKMLKKRKVLPGKFIRYSDFEQGELHNLLKLVDEMGWSRVLDVRNEVTDVFVYQFYANLEQDTHGCFTAVDNTLFTFNTAELNELLGCPNEGSTFASKNTFSPIFELSEFKKMFFPTQELTMISKLKMSSFSPMDRVLYYLICEIFMPIGGNRTYIRLLGMHLMYGLIKGIKINLGAFIIGHMLNCKESSSHGLPYGRIIMLLCRSKGLLVGGDLEEGTHDMISRTTIEGLNLIEREGKWWFKRSQIHNLDTPGARSDRIWEDKPPKGSKGKEKVGESSAPPPETAPPPPPQMPMPSVTPSVPSGGPTVSENVLEELKEIKYMLRFMMRQSLTKAQRNAYKAYREKKRGEELIGEVKDTTSEEDEEDEYNDSHSSKSTSSANSTPTPTQPPPNSPTGTPMLTGKRVKMRAKKKIHDVNVGPSGDSDDGAEEMSPQGGDEQAPVEGEPPKEGEEAKDD